MSEEFERKDDDFLAEFRERVSVDPFKELEAKEVIKEKKSKGVLFGVIVGVAIAAIGGYKVYQASLDQNMGGDVPVIKRSDSPVKVKPAEPGGMDVPNRDKSVYSRIGGVEDEGVVENVLPPPEEPEIPPELVAEANQSPVAEPAAVVVEQAPVTAPEEPKEEVAKIAVVEPPAPVATPVKVAPEPVPVAITEAPKAVAPAKVEPVAIAQSAEISKGAWQVQLGSSQNKAGLEKNWASIKSRYKAAIGDVPSEIVEAKVNGQTYYRLRLGNFKSKTEAANYCAELKKAKLDCFVAQKK